VADGRTAGVTRGMLTEWIRGMVLTFLFRATTTGVERERRRVGRGRICDEFECSEQVVCSRRVSSGALALIAD